MPEAAAQVRMSDAEVAQMICRYSRRAQFLETGLAAAQGDHEGAETALEILSDTRLRRGFRRPRRRTRVSAHLCANPVRDRALRRRPACAVGSVVGAGARCHRPASRNGGQSSRDYLRVLAATAYGRFCVETGRLAEARTLAAARRSPGASRRMGISHGQNAIGASGGVLVGGRPRDNRAAGLGGLSRHRTARPGHDVVRCWLYLGLTRLASGALEAADECWEHAERHWRELGKPLHIHRILLQRSWIAIFWSRFADAVELIAQARELLDSSPRSSWLQYAQLDNHLGTVWRADALADLGFDSCGRSRRRRWRKTEARQAEGARHPPRRGRHPGILARR